MAPTRWIFSNFPVSNSPTTSESNAVLDEQDDQPEEEGGGKASQATLIKDNSTARFHLLDLLEYFSRDMRVSIAGLRK